MIMTWWQDETMTGWPDDRMTRWPDDQMTGWPDYRMAGWQEASQMIDRMIYGYGIFFMTLSCKLQIIHLPQGWNDPEILVFT